MTKVEQEPINDKVEAQNQKIIQDVTNRLMSILGSIQINRNWKTSNLVDILRAESLVFLFLFFEK